MEKIQASIQQTFPGARINILDAGCGHGRLSVPLAKLGHTVIGVDISPSAIDKAEEHAQNEDVHIQWMRGELLEVLKPMASDSFDCVLALEVLYLCPNYQEVMEELVRVLKPNGLICISLHTKYFITYQALVEKEYPRALFVLRNREGFGINWHTQAEAEALLRQHDCEVLQVFGVGCALPKAPEFMDGEYAKSPEISTGKVDDGRLLWEIERILGDLDDAKGCARYLLLIGIKK